MGVPLPQRGHGHMERRKLGGILGYSNAKCPGDGKQQT
jgi:hypothetical protein